ncbi:MAG: cysteine desulfurase [Planctomycetes bacterium]|nr:cysteine desulfurase [Planctomycetota bacterium]
MIYLDYNASTPVDPVVRKAMLPYLGTYYGNPSSSHAAGRPLRDAVETARQRLAALLGADPDEIVFTSSGTEANNYVLKGVAHALRPRGRHIITSAIEHPAILNPCRHLEKLGYEVSYVGVDAHGMVDPQEVAAEVRAGTILISIMHANNEVGTIQPIAEIAEIARTGGIWIHTDAAQSCGKIPTNTGELGVTFLSIAGHKLYAPQGVGALYIRRGVQIEPLLHGAGHEQGRRAGTEAVSAIVGLGVAAELAGGKLGDSRLAALRDRLHQGLQDRLGDVVVLLGHPTQRLPNTLAVGFRGRVGSELLAACPDLCASTGAACHSGERKRSAVLAAMNVPEEIAFGAVRFSVGRLTTEVEIDAAVEQIVRAVAAGR